MRKSGPQERLIASSCRVMVSAMAIIILAFGFPHAGSAQGLTEPESATKRTRWHFGFTFGPEITHVDLKLKDGRNPDLDLVLGFHAGIAIGVDIGPFTLRTGLNFVNAGALFDGTGFLARDEFDVSFLTIPVDLRLTPFKNKYFRPYIFAGPGFRYGLDLAERPIAIQNDIRLLDATFEAGLGVSIRIPGTPLRFSPEMRYVSDVFGIYSGELEADDGGLVETAESVKANAVRVGLLLGF